MCSRGGEGVRVPLDRVFVARMPFSTSVHELEAVFAPYGKVTNVHIPKDYYSGKPKGIGFVTFGSAECAQQAVAAAPHRIGSNKLEVELAQPKGPEASAAAMAAAAAEPATTTREGNKNFGRRVGQHDSERDSAEQVELHQVSGTPVAARGRGDFTTHSGAKRKAFGAPVGDLRSKLQKPTEPTAHAASREAAKTAVEKVAAGAKAAADKMAAETAAAGRAATARAAAEKAAAEKTAAAERAAAERAAAEKAAAERAAAERAAAERAAAVKRAAADKATAAKVAAERAAAERVAAEKAATERAAAKQAAAKKAAAHTAAAEQAAAAEVAANTKAAADAQVAASVPAPTSTLDTPVKSPRFSSSPAINWTTSGERHHSRMEEGQGRSDSKQTTREFHVPAQTARYIVGKKGATICELQTKTGCVIDVERGDVLIDGKPMRTVKVMPRPGLHGDSLQAVDAAVEQIKGLVSDCTRSDLSSRARAGREPVGPSRESPQARLAQQEQWRPQKPPPRPPQRGPLPTQEQQRPPPEVLPPSLPQQDPSPLPHTPEQPPTSSTSGSNHISQVKPHALPSVAETTTNLTEEEPSTPLAPSAQQPQIVTPIEAISDWKQQVAEAHNEARSAKAEAQALREQLDQLASSEAFNIRCMAFQQYIDFLRENAGKMAQKSWKLKVRRGYLVSDVLDAFGKLRSRGELWRTTDVVFFDINGDEEEGMDRGGLSTELHAKFWDGVVKEDENLFEKSPESEGGSLLPRADASPERLYQLGRVLCKAIIDGHPIGGGLARFLFESLVSDHHAERRVFDKAKPRAALHALRDYDADLAARWSGLLDGSTAVEACGLTLDSFDDVLGEGEVTAANLPLAIVAGCRRRLLAGREGALRSLREGFTEYVDLTLQLAALSCNDMLLMVQGRLQISPDELASCFTWPDDSAQAAAEANFPAGSRVPEYLRSLILDLDEASRFRFLQWATALRALPSGGLKEDSDRITLRYMHDGDDAYLPVAHTCTHELDLPDYSSYEALKEKLDVAIQHANDGFTIQ